MAEGVLFDLAGSLIEMLGSAAFEEARLLYGVKDEFQKLVGTIEVIKGVLLDAEEKMVVDNQVKAWLKRLGDIFIVADDLVDKFHTEPLQRRVMSGNKFTRQLWMAHRFIKYSDDKSQSLEEIGYGYFINLLWRSFFQEPQTDEFGDIRTCKMHDLMHDLAISVAGSNSVIIDQNPKISNEKCLHVSLVNFDFDLETNNSLEIDNLPSLKSISIYNCLNLTSVLEGIDNLPSLKSIYIRDCPNLTPIPDNFRKMWGSIIMDYPKLEERECN